MSEKYFTVNIQAYLDKDANAQHTLSALAFEICLIQNAKSDSLIYISVNCHFFFFYSIFPFVCLLSRIQERERKQDYLSFLVNNETASQ